MTTKVHIVNFGPQPIKIIPYNPETEVLDTKTFAPEVYPQQSVDLYVHSTQALMIIEKT